MSKDENLEVISKLQNAIDELDHNRVNWTEKYLLMDLKDKAQVLLESVSRLDNDEKEAAIIAAKAFLTEIKPVIKELNNQIQEK